MDLGQAGAILYPSRTRHLRELDASTFRQIFDLWRFVRAEESDGLFSRSR